MGNWGLTRFWMLSERQGSIKWGFLALKSGIWDRVLKEGNMQNGIARVLVNFQWKQS